MEQKFTLSKSNKIYFGVIAILFFILFISFSDKTPEKMGEFAGRLTSILLFPSLFAWIIWYLSGKKEKGGSFTFNIVLTLILLGQIGQLENKLQQSQKLSELAEKKEEFKKVISNTDDPAQMNAAYSKFADSVKDQFNLLSETSTGSEKQFYSIMGDFIAETQAANQKWAESFHAVQSPRILNYSLLNSDEEFNHQRNILWIYVENSKAYNEFFINSIPNLKKRLDILGEGSEIAKRAITGAREKHLSQKPIFEPLIHAHIEYGKNMIQILELLEKNKDDWTYENDELLIYSDIILNEYNNLIKLISHNEETINRLQVKAIEEM